MDAPEDVPAEASPPPSAAGFVPHAVDAGDAFAGALEQARTLAMGHSEQMAQQEGNTVN